MSPVNRAGSVSKISPRHSFLCKNINKFIQYERLGSYLDLGFCDQYLSNRDENFPI